MDQIQKTITQPVIAYSNPASQRPVTGYQANRNRELALSGLPSEETRDGKNRFIRAGRIVLTTVSPSRVHQKTCRAVIFDMDNTLFDFVAAQLAACRMVLTHLGLPGDGEALFCYFLRPVHGFESYGNIQDFLEENGIFTRRSFAECCAIYDAQKLAAIAPYPGIPAVLERLGKSAVPCAVVTDARQENAVQRLDKAGLLSFFSAVISPGESGAPKPDPASFLLALARLGLSAEETVCVGDSIRRDIRPAQQAGMTTIHAQYGDRYSAGGDMSCVPDYCASDVSRLGSILDGILAGHCRADRKKR